MKSEEVLRWFSIFTAKISGFLLLPWSLIDWSEWNTSLAVLIAEAVEAEIKSIISASVNENADFFL